MTSISFEEALLHAVQGQALIFLGAGFSTLFKDIESRALPIGNQLAKEMVDACNGRPTNDLRVAATQLLKGLGSEKYITFLRDRFTVRDIEPEAIKIAGENWIRIYTTNYDDGYEKAATQARRKVSTSTISDDVQQFLHSNRVCIHIHGFIDRISSKNVENDIVLTLPGYASGEFWDSPWHNLLKYDFRAAKSIFFLGYSLGDLDIARTLNQCGLDIADKTFFITKKGGDTDLEILLQDFGSFQPIGVDGFAEALTKIDRTTLPKTWVSYEAFNELLIPKNPVRISSADMQKLLWYGMTDENLLLAPLVTNDNQQYTVPRQVVSEITKLVASDHPNFFSVLSEISNGKTIALYQLSRALIEKNFRVFMLKDPSRNWSEELQQIFKSEPNHVAFVVDDCCMQLECLKDIARLLRNGDVLIVADRTIKFDSFEGKLDEFIGENKFIEFEIDELNETERFAFDKLLHTYGYWGDLQGAPAHHRNKTIERESSNQIRGILLGILKSPSAINRLQESLGDIDFRDKNFDGLLMCLILVVTQAVELRQDVVDDLVGSTPLRVLLAKSQTAKTLVQLKSPNLIRPVSAIVAETIIRRFVPLDSLIRCLVNAIKTAKAHGISDSHRAFPKKIIQFRLIQQLLPDTETRSLEAIEEIYDIIKTEPGYSNDPQFWLQYAICQLFLRNFNLAENYFKNAYSVCRPGYIKKFIDNHYARYLLENAISGPKVPLLIADAEDQLNKAKSLLIPQFDDNDHYPYKVATNILPFSKMYAKLMSEEGRQGLMRFVENIASKADSAIKGGNHHRYIYQCKKALEQTREVIEESGS